MYPLGPCIVLTPERSRRASHFTHFTHCNTLYYFTSHFQTCVRKGVEDVSLREAERPKPVLDSNASDMETIIPKPLATPYISTGVEHSRQYQSGLMCGLSSVVRFYTVVGHMAQYFAGMAVEFVGCTWLHCSYSPVRTPAWRLPCCCCMFCSQMHKLASVMKVRSKFHGLPPTTSQAMSKNRPSSALSRSVMLWHAVLHAFAVLTEQCKDLCTAGKS